MPYSNWEILAMIGEVDEIAEKSGRLAEELVEEVKEVMHNKPLADRLGMISRIVKHLIAMHVILEINAENFPLDERAKTNMATMLLVNVYELYKFGYEQGKKVGKLEAIYGGVQTTGDGPGDSET